MVNENLEVSTNHFFPDTINLWYIEIQTNKMSKALDKLKYWS